mmetsp:Transcript_37579/g.118481  ORF Transcript_37579/g.118481 Transcript_37579/m.118481 type:complete len:285 (+) Transcript_37579:1295-2149(+)
MVPTLGSIDREILLSPPPRSPEVSAGKHLLHEAPVPRVPQPQEYVPPSSSRAWRDVWAWADVLRWLRMVVPVVWERGPPPPFRGKAYIWGRTRDIGFSEKEKRRESSRGWRSWGPRRGNRRRRQRGPSTCRRPSWCPSRTTCSGVWTSESAGLAPVPGGRWHQHYGLPTVPTVRCQCRALSRLVPWCGEWEPSITSCAASPHSSWSLLPRLTTSSSGTPSPPFWAYLQLAYMPAKHAMLRAPRMARSPETKDPRQSAAMCGIWSPAPLEPRVGHSSFVRPFLHG